MIFYNSPMPAPNPRRVRIFAAEKGIALPTQDVSLLKREHKSAEFLALNPLGQTPTLKLDDGSIITESVAICRYLEALQPDPPLFGADAKSIGQIDMWSRRVEMLLGAPVGMIWVHTHPLTAAIVPERFPEFGESNRPRVRAAMALCNEALGQTEFLAGDYFSMADINLLCTIDFAGFIGLPIADDLDKLRGWHARVSARPSAAA
jgi:glutathione S-transferase